MELTYEERHPFDPILEFVKFYGSQKEYLTKERGSDGYLKTPQKWTKFIQDYLTKPSHPETLLQIKPLRAHWKHRMALKSGKENKPRAFYFVTISPPEHITIKAIKKLMVSIQNWSCWTEFIGVIEQRGITEKDIHGAHIHFLAIKSEKYAHSNVKQRLKYHQIKYNTNIQVIDDTFAPDKQGYFFSKYGKTKKGEDKSKIMAIDVIFRKNNDIPRYYGEKIKFIPLDFTNGKEHIILENADV